MNALIAIVQRHVQPHWPAIKKWLILLMIAVVAVIVVRQARTIAWRDVHSALSSYQADTLLQGGLLGIAAYTLYASFDLIGIRYVGAHVAVPRTMAIAFVAYAINQSFGALLGTVGMRLRLYGKLGLSPIVISKLAALAVVTNWLGYLLVAGTMLTFQMIHLPDSWRVNRHALQLLGIAMLMLVVVYLAMCCFSRTRAITIRHESLALPHPKLAMMQALVSTPHWFAIAAILYLLLQGRVSYTMVLGTFMLTSISAVITRVPAGLGVIEAIFIAVLGGVMPGPQVLAALLAFRGIFYIGALLLAGMVYVALESSGARVVANDA